MIFYCKKTQYPAARVISLARFTVGRRRGKGCQQGFLCILKIEQLEKQDAAGTTTQAPGTMGFHATNACAWNDQTSPDFAASPSKGGFKALQNRLI